MPSHSNSTRPEILAPAGNADMLCAAVFAGADAVYSGLQIFNARRTAAILPPKACGRRWLFVMPGTCACM